MKKENKKEIEYRGMIRNVVIYGLLTLIVSSLLLVLKINSSKTNIAENLLSLYINKNVRVSKDPNIPQFKVKTNKEVSCSTSLFSETTCTIFDSKIGLISQSGFDPILSSKEFSISIKTPLMAYSLRDIINSDIEFGLDSKDLSMEDTFLSLGLGMNPLMLEDDLKKEVLENIYGQFKKTKIKLKGSLIQKSNGAAVAIDFSSLSKDWYLGQKTEFDFRKYDKDKVYTDKTTLNDSSIEENKFVSSYEIFVKESSTHYGANNSVDNLIKGFYTYYKLSFLNKTDKSEYNTFYLDLDSDKMVSFSEFKTVLAPLVKKASDNYTLSSQAPLFASISSIFNGGYGVKYTATMIKEVPLAYLTHIMKTNPLRGNRMNKESFKRDIYECKDNKECKESFIK